MNIKGVKSDPVFQEQKSRSSETTELLRTFLKEDARFKEVSPTMRKKHKEYFSKNFNDKGRERKHLFKLDKFIQTN